MCQFTNGSLYKGEWREDRPSGVGIFFSFPNEIIECKFDGWKVADGQAKILFANGEYFEGQIKQGSRCGQGNHYYLNGDTYEGPWDNDRRGGKNRGRIKFKDGGMMDARFI